MVIDLDDPSTWPEALVERLSSLLPSIAAEKRAQTVYDLSSDRWIRDSPSSPATKQAEALICDLLRSSRLRVFHATRLLDFQTVRNEGLRPLDLTRQIDAVRRALVSEAQVASEAEFAALTAGVDLHDPFYRNRQGQVWAVPVRTLLHDGGCEIFFAHYGGEAIQRLANEASPSLTAAIQAIGTPAIVTFNIPAFGHCTFGDLRLAPTMLDLALRHAGLIDEDHRVGWDVLVKGAIPPAWIEDVSAIGRPVDFY
jgi:hypothetical protein